MDTLIPMIVMAVVGFLVIAMVVRSVPASERHWLIVLLAVSLVLRLAVAACFGLFPETKVFHEDALGCEAGGMNLAAAWRGDGPPFHISVSSNYGFYYVAGAVYYVFGPLRPAVSFVNTVVGMLTVFFVYRVARMFAEVIVARRAAIYAAYMPSMILWSAIAIKDALMSLLILICLFSCLHLKRRFSLGAVLGTVLPIVAVQPIRFYLVYFLVFAVGTALVLERGTRSLTGIYKQLVLGGAVAVLFTIAGVAGGAREGFDLMSFERVSAFRHGMAVSAQSGFAQDVDISTPGKAIAFIPVGVATALFAPFPWHFTSLRALFAAPEMVVWWTLVPSLLTGLWFAAKHRWRETSPILIFAATMTVAYSLMHGNVGSAFRQRAQIFIFLFIFTALGRYVRRCRKAGVDEQLLLVGEHDARRVAAAR